MGHQLAVGNSSWCPELESRPHPGSEQGRSAHRHMGGGRDADLSELREDRCGVCLPAGFHAGVNTVAKQNFGTNNSGAPACHRRLAALPPTPRLRPFAGVLLRFSALPCPLPVLFPRPFSPLAPRLHPLPGGHTRPTMRQRALSSSGVHQCPLRSRVRPV